MDDTSFHDRPIFFSRNSKIQRETNQTLRDQEPAKRTTLEHGLEWHCLVTSFEEASGDKEGDTFERTPLGARVVSSEIPCSLVEKEGKMLNGTRDN